MNNKISPYIVSISYVLFWKGYVIGETISPCLSVCIHTHTHIYIYTLIYVYIYIYIYVYIYIGTHTYIFAQSAGAVEYTDCTSAEG